MKTSVVVLAVLSLAILVSVSGRNVVQARDVWPGPNGVTATDGIHPGEAVITWDTVEKAAYYRIGWVAQADREVGTDGDAKWREGFVFADVANRGQASHLITGLTPGVEYDFVVASHDGRWSRLPGTGGLASLRLGEDASYFRLFDAAEAEVALEPVEEGRYRRIGWIAEEAYRNAVDGDGDWRRSVQFVDLANRGQTSQVITGLKLGAEYYVAVASHDDPGGVTGWPDAGEWELVTARSAWQSVSFQNSEACAAQDMVTLPTGFREGIATYLCQDDAGENYWIFVPTGYTDPDAVVEQLHGRAFDELGEVDNRVEAYRSLIVEVASQKALGERSHLSVFFDFNEGSRGPITAADEIIGDVIDAYALGYQEDSQQYRDLENHLGYLLEHSDIYDDRPFGSIEFDAAIMAAVSRTIFIDQTREHVRLLEQLPMDSAWAKAIEEAQEILNRKSSGDDLTEWGEALEKYHDEIVLGLHVVAEVGAHVAAHAIGTALGIAGFPVVVALSAVVFVGFQVYERIHETNEFWDDLTLATVAAQAYWHTHRNRRDDGAFASEARRALLGYTEFSFYQHLYLAADNPLTGASPIGIGNLGETNPSEFVQTLLERRDLVLDRLIDSAWEPTRDFKPLYDATGLPSLRGLNEPTGMWSDGDTMWVSQKAGTTLRAFDMETKLWVEELDFDTARPYEGISFTDIWSDEETMWIAARLLLDQGSTSGGLYAYEVTSQQDDATQSLYTLAGRNHLPWGVWSNGTTIWVSNTAVSKIYAYDLATRQRDRAKDFDGLRLAGNDSPHGIWSNEKTMWVADREDDKVYAYDLATARRDPAREFNLVNVPGVVTNTEPGGIWSDRTSMWVIDGAERKIFAYALPEAPATVEAFPFGRDPAGDLSRLNATENHHAEGIWSDGTTMWVADHDDDHVYAYRLSDGARVEELEFDLYNRLLFEGNHHARGIWSDSTTMWVADHDDDRIYAYRLSDGARVEELEFGDEVLKAAGNEDASGIWFDATTMTMWVADRSDDLIYGYDQATKTLVRTIDTLKAAGNHDAEGIWSDGTTMWVTDQDDDRVYAYRLSDGARVSDLEFDTPSAAGNHDMKGIWSDGTTMWVVDQDLAWVYAYHMPPLAAALPLGNPTGLTAAPGSQSGEVALSWSPADNATVHWVYLVKPDGTDGRYWHALAGDAATLTVTGLDAGETYLFLVIAGQEQADGTTRWSQWSNWGQATLPATAPASPASAATNSISSGNLHTCGLRADGSAVCWGLNNLGQATPPAGETFAAISNGTWHTCGLRADGSAACWGWNGYGQATPPAGATFAAISSGNLHTCGLRADGSAACWGWNEYGQATPPAGATFAAISSSWNHTCGLRSDGSVVCWGRNHRGQTAAPAGETFTAISSGSGHTCGLRADGSAVCWGSNNFGQATPPGATFAAISRRGGAHTCGLRADGSAVCWGRNDFGQATPPAGATFAAISSGGWHTCGLRADGSAVCWGLNNFGQSTPPAGATFAAATAASNGKYDTDGDRLIEISSLEQLDAIRYDLDGDGISSDAAYGSAFPISAGEVVCDDCNGYELIRSLDFRDPGSYLSGSVNAAWTTGSGWQPIAGDIHSWPDNFDSTISGYTFTATLAGNGHTVSNLYANRSSYRGVALFRHTGRSSVIRDIGLTEVNLTGGNDVGALAGFGFGKIIASYASGAISGRLSVGGLTGTNVGGITASYSKVNVQGIGHVGGLVGWNAGSIDASYAVGEVAGVWDNTGGLSGVDSGNVRAGYWDRQTSGQATSAGGEGQTTVELQAPTGYTGIYGNWNVDVDGDTLPDAPWDFGNSRQYPVLKYGGFSVAGQR